MAAKSPYHLVGFLAQVIQFFPEGVAILTGPDHQRMTLGVADQH
jgi:hypothetical protein